MLKYIPDTAPIKRQIKSDVCYDCLNQKYYMCFISKESFINYQEKSCPHKDVNIHRKKKED